MSQDDRLVVPTLVCKNLGQQFLRSDRPRIVSEGVPEHTLSLVEPIQLVPGCAKLEPASQIGRQSQGPFKAGCHILPPVQFRKRSAQVVPTVGIRWIEMSGVLEGVRGLFKTSQS